MKKALILAFAFPLSLTLTSAQTARSANVKDIVELELLTHTEVNDKIHNEGKTSVLVVAGGTEERGPHDVLGGHNIIARHNAIEIAKKLGNALVAPILPVAVS